MGQGLQPCFRLASPGAGQDPPLETHGPRVHPVPLPLQSRLPPHTGPPVCPTLVSGSQMACCRRSGLRLASSFSRVGAHPDMARVHPFLPSTSPLHGKDAAQMHRWEALVRAHHAPPLSKLPRPAYKRGGQCQGGRPPRGVGCSWTGNQREVLSETGWVTSQCGEPCSRRKGDLGALHNQQ